MQSVVLFAALWAASGTGYAQTGGAASLRQSFAAARDDPAADIFGRPLYLQSTETADSVQGDVHAVIDFPYDEVRQSLLKPEDWCRMLILHPNLHYCRPAGAAPRQLLVVGTGRKDQQALSDLFWVDFSHRVASDGDDYLAVELQAPKGPLSTKDYRIVIEATPYAPRKTLLHLRYAYGYGLSARLAMQAYLSTLGLGKVGFSSVGGQRVGGVRGALERNTMRYYLAIEAQLATRNATPAQRTKASLQTWFDATERYPAQLKELDKAEYIDMKLREVARQDNEAPPTRRN